VTGTTTIRSAQVKFIPSIGFGGGFSNVSVKPIMGTTKRLDLYDEDTFVLNFQITTDFSSRASNYSKTIKVPGTPNNNEIFKMLFDENLFIGNTTGDTVIFLNKRIPAGIYQDTIQLMVGYFELEKVIKGEYFIEYEGTFYGNVKSLADSIGDKMLSNNDNPLDDLDFSEWDHLYTIPNVIASYNNTTMYNNSVGYFYPFIDYQGFDDGTKLDFTCVRPALYVKELWDKIFSDAGYQYTSNFLNGTEFKSLIIPLTKNVAEDTFESDKNKFQIGISVNMSGDTSGTTSGTFSHGSSMTGWTYWSGYDIAGYSGGILPAVQSPCNTSSSYAFKCGLHNFYSYSDGRTRGVRLPFDQMSGCLTDYSNNSISLFNNSGSTGLSWDTTNKWWNVRRSGNYKLHAFISYDLFGKPYDSSNSPFYGSWTSGDEYGQYNTVEIGLHCYRITPSGVHENIGETVETVYINNPHVGNFGDPNPKAFANNAGTKGEDWILNNQVISLDIQEQDLYVNDKVYFHMTIRAGQNEFKWRSVGTPMTGGWIQTWVMVNKILSYCNNDYNNKPYLYEGNMVHMNNLLPDMKQIDLIKGISNMYNLIYQEDKDVPGNIIIEPWNDFFMTGMTETTDWTYKVDGKGEEVIDRIPDLVNKDILFQYAKDSNDDLTKKYTEEYNVPYGSMSITNPYLSEGNTKIDSLFSTCFIKNFGTSSWLMSSLWNESKRKNWLTDNKKSDQTFSTKIMYRKKLVPTDLDGQTLSKISILSYLSGTTSGTTSGTNWYRLGEFYFGAGTTRNFFPYAGHWDNPYKPTKDLNWGVQKYYFSKLHKYTVFNLFKNYWRWKIALYMDPNSKLVTFTMRLNHSDIAMLNFRKKIRIGNSYYYLNKIIDWTNGQECKVELIRYTYYDLPLSINTPTWKVFQSAGCQNTGGSTGGGGIGGGGTTIIGPPGGGLMLNLGGNLLTNNETYSDQTGDLDMGSTPYTNNSFPPNSRGIIMGKNNTINSNDSFVHGDNNVVNDSNTVLIGSKNNTVNQKDVVLIGSQGNNIDVSNEFDFNNTGTTVSGVTNLNTSVLINSNNNTITDSKIVLMNSSDNVIFSGVTDVVLIGTTGITVTENNKTYISGKDLSTVATEDFVYSTTGNTYAQAVTDSQSYTDLKSGTTETWVSDNYSSKSGTFNNTIKTTRTYETNGEFVIGDNYTGTGRTITLMNVDKIDGKVLIVHDLASDATAHNIVISEEGGGTFTTLNSDNRLVFIYSDGSNWYTNNS
jgi:hypothetical protein